MNANCTGSSFLESLLEIFTAIGEIIYEHVSSQRYLYGLMNHSMEAFQLSFVLQGDDFIYSPVLPGNLLSIPCLYMHRARMYFRLSIDVCANGTVCICVFVCPCACVCVSVHVHARGYVFVHVCICMHIRIILNSPSE